MSFSTKSREYLWIKFITQCIDHDYWYMMSDSHQVFTKGQNNLDDIHRLANFLGINAQITSEILHAIHTTPKSQSTLEKK